MNGRRGLLMNCGGQLKITPHDMSSNEDHGLIVSQSSDIDGKRLAFRAMDGALTSEGHESHTSSENNAWWRINFQKPVIVKQIVWQWRRREDGSLVDESGWGDAVKTVMLQGSNDGSTWIDVQQITHEGVGDVVFAINGETAYNQWRLISLDGRYLIIGEIEFTYMEG